MFFLYINSVSGNEGNPEDVCLLAYMTSETRVTKCLDLRESDAYFKTKELVEKYSGHVWVGFNIQSDLICLTKLRRVDLS